MSGDGQWAPYEPASPDGHDPEALPEGSAATRTPVPRRGAGRWALVSVLVPLVVVAAGAVFVFATAGDDSPAGTDSSVGTGNQSGAAAEQAVPDPLSASGLAELRADVAEHTGGTRVFRAVLYPAYASIELPVDRRTQRAETLYWDGDLDLDGSKGTATNGRVDLARVDADVVRRVVRTAKRLVEDPGTWYAVVDGPSTVFADDAVPRVTAYATNEYGESARVEVALDGTELSRYVSGP